MSLLASILQTAATVPKNLAGVEGQETLSYAELATASGVLRRKLADLGLQPGSTLALSIPNSLQSMVSLVASLRLGADLLLLDPSLKPGEVAEFCRIAGVSLILTQGETGDGTGPRRWIVPTVRALLAGLAPGTAADSETEAPGSASAFLLLSSGTTGSPKIVRRTAGQAEAALHIFEAEVPCLPTDRVLAVMPFYHSFGLLFTLCVTLRAGAALYLDTFTPRGTARAIDRDQITVLPATPFMFRMLAETRYEPVPSFGSLRLAISAGTGLPAAVSTAFQDKFRIGILQAYGSTESGPVALGCPGDRLDRPGWVGRPYSGIHLEFLTSSASSATPEGFRTGSMVVRSPGNASGYVENSEATATVFRDGAVHIGDLGYLDASGTLFVLGRERPMLNVGGKKVSPAEVEACLKSHPGISDAVVTGIPAPDGGDRIRAVLAAEPSLTTQEIQAFVGQRLAEFKVPREIQFAESDTRTSLGKLKHNSMAPPATASPDARAPILALLKQVEKEALEIVLRHGKDVERAVRNLLPDLPTREIPEIARQTVIHQMKNQFLGHLMRVGRFREILPLIHYHQEEILLEMQSRGESAILTFSHNGPFGGISIGLSGLGLPVTSLRNVTQNPGHREPLPFIDQWDAKLGSLEEKLFPKHAVGRMKQGSFVLLGLDGRLGGSHIPLPCLGRQMGFPLGPAFLHRVTHAPVIPLSVQWAPEDEFIDFKVHPPLTGDGPELGQARSDEKALTRNIARWMEDFMRSNPGQIHLNRLPLWLSAPKVGSLPGPMEPARPQVERKGLLPRISNEDPPRVHRIEVGGFQNEA